MSDRITATAAASLFKAHDEGQYVAQCVDTIDLGRKVQDFPGKVPYLAPTCALVRDGHGLRVLLWFLSRVLMRVVICEPCYGRRRACWCER